MKRLFTLALTAAVGLLAASCQAADASTPRPDTSAAHCHTAQYGVSVPGATGTQITGDYCTPARSNGTVLLLVGGGGENADYWATPGLPSYSLARAASAQGYTTLAVDRLGTGRSSTPVSSIVTYAAQVDTLHQVAADLHRQGWHRVIGIGHSLGSGALMGVAAQYPADLEAVALTGYGPAVSPQTAQRNALYQKAANIVDPARWGKLDDGYLTTTPEGVPFAGSFYLPGTSPRALRIAETLQGTHTKAELTTRPQGDSAIAQGAALTGPVLVLDGQEDDHYCTNNAVGDPVHIAPVCTSQAAFRAYERALFANARLTTYLVGHTGHATELHESAPYTNQLILLWVAVSAVSAPQAQ